MSGRKRKEKLEAASNAISGYIAIVLALACFVLALMLVMALTRFFAGLSLAPSPTATVQNSPQASVAQVDAARPLT